MLICSFFLRAFIFSPTSLKYSSLCYNISLLGQKERGGEIRKGKEPKVIKHSI